MSREERRIRLLFALRDGSFEKKPNKFLPLLLGDSQLQHDFIYTLFSEIRIDSAPFIAVINILNKCEEDARKEGRRFLNLHNELGVDRTAVHLAILNNQPIEVIKGLLAFGVPVDAEDIGIDAETLFLGYPEWTSRFPEKKLLITMQDLAIASDRPEVIKLLNPHQNSEKNRIEDEIEVKRLFELIDATQNMIDKQLEGILSFRQRENANIEKTKNWSEVKDFFELLDSCNEMLAQKAAELSSFSGSPNDLEEIDLSDEVNDSIELNLRSAPTSVLKDKDEDELKEDLYQEQSKKTVTRQYDKAKVVHTDGLISILEDGIKIVHHGGHVKVLEDGTKVVTPVFGNGPYADTTRSWPVIGSRVTQEKSVKDSDPLQSERSEKNYGSFSGKSK